MPPNYDPGSDPPARDSTPLIDFERIQIRTLRSFPPQHVLVVSGTKPQMNVEVTLEPRVYARKPEYWGIEVAGRLPGAVGPPALAPYEVSTPLAGITGTLGIEVIGATRSERRNVPTGDPQAGELLFSRDDRPGDGELRELTIAEEAGDTFIAMLHTAYADRVNGEPVEETTLLAAGLSGTIEEALVRLSRDERPADGVLKELVVARNAEGTFDATLRTAFLDRLNGREVDETVDIGSGLTKR